MKINKGSTLVMIGDSITDAGRMRPIGEQANSGNGYVYMVDALLGAVYPERVIRVINTGTGGNTVRDLKARWQTDVLDLQPNWVSVMIGVNDVWRQFDSVKHPQFAVYTDEYERVYTEIVAATRPLLTGGMVLMTPFYVEPNAHEPMRARIDQYGQIVKRIAHEYDCLLADTQAYFDEATRHVYPGALAADRVHPNMYGTAILARAFLKAVDFEF